VCPFGFLQEMLYKIPSPKFTLWKPLGYGKYLSLLLLVIAVPYFLGTDSSLYFCRLCPAAAIEASLPFAVMQGGFPSFWGPVIRFSLFGVIILLVISSMRFFCRVLCPVGAMTALFNPISAFALRQKTEACPECGGCSKVCPVDIDLTEKKQAELQEYTYKAPADCILCLQCTHACNLSDGLKGSFAGMAKKDN
jgi:polyferredoxin